MRPVASLGFERLPLHFPPALLARTRVGSLPAWLVAARWPYVGITLGDRYFLAPSVVADEAVHAHELVHVVQWHALGTARFLARYARLFLLHGYVDNPLEQTAYRIEARFRKGDAPFDAVAEALADL